MIQGRWKAILKEDPVPLTCLWASVSFPVKALWAFVLGFPGGTVEVQVTVALSRPHLPVSGVLGRDGVGIRDPPPFLQAGAARGVPSSTPTPSH